MKKNLQKVRYWLIMAFVVFVLAELGMILMEPWIKSDFFEYDRDLGFRVRAYAQGTNRFGFNDRDYVLEKPGRTTRLLVLSDSYNWAGGKEGNYTHLLEQRLNSSDSSAFEVINAGYPMTHTAEQLALLKKFGLQYAPDHVIVGFFCGNDFIDASPTRKRIVLHDTYFDIDRREERFFLGRPFVWRSRLFYFFKQKIIVLFHTDKSREEFNKRKEAGCLFTEETFLEVEYQRLQFYRKQLQAEGVYKDNIKYILDSFREMKRLLRKRGVQLTVAIFPAEFQVDDKHFENVLKARGLSASAYDRFLPQKILHSFLDEEQIQYIDMLPVFREQAKEESLYLCRNTHWNTAGNALAADILTDYLQAAYIQKPQQEKVPN